MHEGFVGIPAARVTFNRQNGFIACHGVRLRVDPAAGLQLPGLA